MGVTRWPGGMVYVTHDGLNSCIGRYHLDNHIIDAQLNTAVENGQRSLGLAPMLWQGGGPEPIYLDWANGHFTPQNALNIVALLKSARAAGFERVYVSPQFWAEHDIRQPTFAQNFDAYYTHNRDFFWDLLGYADQARLDVELNLCTEYDEVGSAAAYTTDLYAFFAIVLSVGVRPQRVSVSIVPGKPQIEALGRLFRNNWPRKIKIHPYIGESQALGYGPLIGLAYLPQVISGLWAVGMPEGTAVDIGETDCLAGNLQDQSAVADVVNCAQSTGIQFEAIYQWQEYLGQNQWMPATRWHWTC